VQRKKRFLRKSKYLFLLFLVFCSITCRRKAAPFLSLLENKQPLFVCGADNSGHYYKFIQNYTVDQNGKIFLWDSYVYGDHIDVYDDQGQFLFQFGRKGEGPGEFRAVGNVSVDSQGDIWVSSGNRKSLQIFSERGEYKEELMLPKEIALASIIKMVFNADDDLFLLCSFIGNKISLYKFDIKENQCQLIHSESKRINAGLVRFMPDFSLDGEGNLYLTDSIDYRIYKYSKDGRLLFIQEAKDFKKERIIEEDFNVFADVDFKIIRFPQYKETMEALHGPSLYFPAIFGVNIDGDTIYVWTSKQDEMKRFMIDVYDMKFNRRCQSSYFNWIKQNLAQIVKGKLHIPSVENENIQLTKNVGRFTVLNFNDQLNVYTISKQLSSKR
jgi:WD40 repeat protein